MGVMGVMRSIRRDVTAWNQIKVLLIHFALCVSCECKICNIFFMKYVFDMNANDGINEILKCKFLSYIF